MFKTNDFVIWLSEKVDWVVLIVKLSSVHALYSTSVSDIYIFKSTPLLQESCWFPASRWLFIWYTLCVTPKYIQPWWYIPPNVEYTEHFRMLLKVVIEDRGCHGYIFLSSFSPVTMHSLCSYCVGVLQVVHSELFGVKLCYSYILGHQV